MSVWRTKWRVVAIMAATAVGGLGAYVVAAQVTGPGASPPGITPEVQANLHMTKPTHDQPTVWGEFLIVPVFAPSEAEETTVNPAPHFGTDSVKTGPIAGPAAPAQAASLVPRFVAVPPTTQRILESKGLTVVGAEASANPDGSFMSNVLYGRTEPSNAMLQLTAFTAVNRVRVTEFPDTAIYDFVASNAIAGNPTITKFPDKGTSDPSGDREVKWSQGGAAYFLKSFGPFTDDELISIATEISRVEATRK